jgi:mannose-1-phosphate guanylyltransferase
MKEKIAISIDKDILLKVDSHIDGMIIQSRSQAIQSILLRGLKSAMADTAVILLHPEHIQIALKNISGISLIRKQVAFLKRNWISRIIVLTGKSVKADLLLSELKGESGIEIVQSIGTGNAHSLLELKGSLPDCFIVMSGDVFNNFNLQGIVHSHLEHGKMATMGLITKEHAQDYGTAVLDGSLIVEFSEKPKKADSHIVNAGIYVFSSGVFSMLEEKTESLERDFFPRIAKMGQLEGYFTRGEYLHAGK